jgi:hypothetical protein
VFLTQLLHERTFNAALLWTGDPDELTAVGARLSSFGMGAERDSCRESLKKETHFCRADEWLFRQRP